MKTFSLIRGASILIYGAGVFGKDIYNRVKDVYNVQCLVDRRTDIDINMTVPIKDSEHISDYKDCAVIVCVHDGNWHYEIAENLYKRGFEQILFLALSDDYRQNESLRMKEKYNLFMESQYDSLVEIPCYSEMKKDYFEENIIRKNEKFVTTYCNKEMLYSYDRIDEHQQGKMSAEIIPFLDVPVMVQKPYIDLFSFFMFGEGNCDLYINNMRQLNNSFDMTEEEFLRSQYLIYQLLEKDYEKGFDAFQYAPIDVKWNPRGYFNVIDGHHRCAFYCLKGVQNMPVRMARKDYDIWMNETCLEAVKAILTKESFLPHTRINHPVLGGYKCRYVEYEKTVLDYMQEWMYDENVIFQSVLELSDLQAYYSRNIYRMKKAEKITAVVGTKKELEFTRALNRLQYITENSVKLRESLEACLREKQRFDLGVICNMYGVDELKDVLNDLGDIIIDTIFWQSKFNAAEEKDYIIKHSKFCKYKHIANKCLEGRLYEIGVFSR